MQMKWWMTIITLILLCGGLPIRVSAELSAAEGILRSKHRQRSYELRWEQQLYLDRRRAQALSPSEQHRLRNLLLDPQLQHSVNCRSIVSPHRMHFHPTPLSPAGEGVSSRRRLASANSPSSATHSSGQQSMGGSSPAPPERYSFLI